MRGISRAEKLFSTGRGNIVLSLLTLLIEFLLLNMIDSPTPSDLLVFIFIFVFSLAFFVDVIKNLRLSEVALPVYAAYLFRLFLVFFDLYCRSIYSLPNSGADTEWFYREGIKYAAFPVKTNELLIRITGYAIRYLGNSRLYLQFLLMLCSLVSVIFADKIMVTIGLNHRRRKMALYVLAFLPNFAILSSIYLREPVVTMFITISLFFFVKWWKGSHEIYFWVAFLFVFAGSSFHSGAIGVAIGYILARVIYNRKSQSIRITLGTIISAVSVLFIFAYLYNNYAELFFGKMLNIQSIEDISRENLVGGSSYAAYAGNSSSISNMIIYTPIRMIMFQFSPFIWQIRGLSDIIALLFDSLFFMYVVYETVVYIRKTDHVNKSLVIILFIVALSTTFIFGWGVTNTGTALRHRNKMTVLYAVLLGLTMHPSWNDEDYNKEV